MSAELAGLENVCTAAQSSWPEYVNLVRDHIELQSRLHALVIRRAKSQFVAPLFVNASKRSVVSSGRYRWAERDGTASVKRGLKPTHVAQTARAPTTSRSGGVSSASAPIPSGGCAPVVE